MDHKNLYFWGRVPNHKLDMELSTIQYIQGERNDSKKVWG